MEKGIIKNKKTKKAAKKSTLGIDKKKKQLPILKKEKKGNSKKFKIAFYIIFIIIAILILYFVSFKKPKIVSTNDDKVVKDMLGVNEILSDNKSDTLSMVALPDNFKVYKDSSADDSGPASIMTILSYYGDVGVFTEDIIKNMKSKHAPFHKGTCVNQIKEILSTLNIKYYDSANYKSVKELTGDIVGLKLVEDSIRAKYPILVGWSKKSPCWSLVVGYDNKGTDDYMDDELLMTAFNDSDTGLEFIGVNEFVEKWDFGDSFNWEPSAQGNAKNCFLLIEKNKES